MNPNLLSIIEMNCAELAELRGRLRRRYEAKLKAVLAIEAEHDDAIRALQEDCTATRRSLLKNLEGGRELFRKPKSQTFHGITVGFEKARASVTMPDEGILVDRIEKLLPPAQAETVLSRSVTVIRNAFKKLPADVLQKLGCSIVTGADQPIVHTQDDDIEALVHQRDQRDQRDAGPKGENTEA